MKRSGFSLVGLLVVVRHRANLARLSLRLLFTELLSTIENVELEAPPRRLHSNLINGIKEMRIRYDVR